MKIVHCMDCNADECVPDFVPEPWICKPCQVLHDENSLMELD